MLQVDRISKNFGGLRALSADMQVALGEGRVQRPAKGSVTAKNCQVAPLTQDLQKTCPTKKGV